MRENVIVAVTVSSFHIIIVIIIIPTKFFVRF